MTALKLELLPALLLLLLLQPLAWPVLLLTQTEAPPTVSSPLQVLQLLLLLLPLVPLLLQLQLLLLLLTLLLLLLLTALRMLLLTLQLQLPQAPVA